MEEKMSAVDNYQLEWSVCRICGRHNRNKMYMAKEMMYGTKEEFEYFICDSCKCMQIANVPGDLGKYYSDNYYSFGENEIPEFEGLGNVESRVLDVGCGSGRWLIERAKMGYGNLYGCDPFIENDVRYGERIFIKKCEISEMEGEFDLIRFGDSFEHIANPLETLENVKKRLSKDGKCQIHIPVFPNAAWETFGVNWYQLDAPRHIFLHSKESMGYLCERCDLKINHIEYNADMWQFIISYLYEEGINLKAIERGEGAGFYANEETFEYFSKMAEECNKKGYGDHAVFDIVHA